MQENAFFILTIVQKVITFLFLFLSYFVLLCISKIYWEKCLVEIFQYLIFSQKIAKSGVQIFAILKVENLAGMH